jgi:outer membrane protein assembly factor BamB
MNDMKTPILLLILLSVSCASLIWEYSTDGPISAKPMIYQSMVIAASDDGNIYAVDPASGWKKWLVKAGFEPNEVFVFDGGVITSTSDAKVVKIGGMGNTLWELNLNTTNYNTSFIYGASANLNYIFVTADNGVFVIEKNGSVKAKIANFNNTLLTAPVAGPDYVIYGKGRELIKTSETGQILWRAKLDEGSFWLSRPVIEGGVIYIGALDSKMHAYVAANGLEMWNARARNWIVSTPLIRSGTVYFGSNDGRIYAVDSGSGETKWTAQTTLAVQSQPEAGTIGGQEVIFIGGTDKSIYAISQETGEIVWKGSAAGAVGSPLFYQNEVIFGSADGKISAYSTERACSITTPTEAEVVGMKEVVVSGKYASEAGNAMVMVQVNTGNWQEANTSETGWVYYLNPKTSFSAGLNTISCKAVDAGGEEVGPTFTTVTINQDPAIQPSNLIITASPDILENMPFVIYVNDADDGSPVDRFKLTIAGKEYEGDKNATVTIAEPGSYEAKITKIGFNDGSKSITVNASGVNPLVVAAGALIIIVVLYQVWSRFLKQKFAKKK